MTRDWRRWPSDLALKALADSWQSVAHTQPLPARTKGGEAEAEAEFNALFGNIFQKGRLMKNKGTN